MEGEDLEEFGFGVGWEVEVGDAVEVEEVWWGGSECKDGGEVGYLWGWVVRVV